MAIGYGNVQLPAPPTLDQIATMGGAINAQNRAAQAAAQAGRIPGEEALATKQSQIIGEEQQGLVPSDVVNLLRQQGAEGSTITGGNPNAAFLRALGLTSIGQQRQGVQDLATALGESPAAPLFDPTTQLLTPLQTGQLQLSAQDLALREQEEQDRMRLAEQELALRRAGGAGGGPRSPGGQAPVDYTLPPPVTSPGGATGAIFGGTPSQADWWRSIGYGAPAATTTATSPGYSYMGPDTSQWSAFGTTDPFGVLGPQPPETTTATSRFSAFGPEDPFGVLGSQPAPESPPLAFQPGDYEAAFGEG